MPAHIIDSAIFREQYGTPDMRAVFEERALIQRWMDIEVALARAEAELGVIPQSAADAIGRAARAEHIDLDALRAGVAQTGHPIVPLIRALQSLCDHDPAAPAGSGEFVHFGATTQDIVDTAVVLQLKQAGTFIKADLITLSNSLRALSEAHKDTLMAGRTHGQQALPITFGYKTAVWVAELDRHFDRLKDCEPRVFIGQFGGASGTLASLPVHGLRIRARMMELLGLRDPIITWHTAHDGFAEFANVLVLIAGTCGKIAREIINLQRSEIWEVEEPHDGDKIGSSTMPHKRNPMVCEAIVALARLAFSAARNAFDGLIQDHERDWTVNQMEWAWVPELCVYTAGALAHTNHVMRDLRVYPDRMRKNADSLGGLMLSEAVMFELAKHVGKQTAHELLHGCSMLAMDTGIPFRAALLHNVEVMQHLNEATIDRLLSPTEYTGFAHEMVVRVLKPDMSVSDSNATP